MLCLKAYVASVCIKCFRYFRDMLQAFHIDVAKVDWDVAYVAMLVHVCCNVLFPMLHLFFRRMFQACLFGCSTCFHTYIARVLS
jgi:hypothetical protein